MTSSVIVDDQHISCISFNPAERNAKLVIDSDAIIARPIPFESFQSVCGRHTQVAEIMRRIQHVKFSRRDRPDSPGNSACCPRVNPVENVFCRPVSEIDDHNAIYCFTVSRASDKIALLLSAGLDLR